jgi:hypothetical protein
MPTYSKSAQGVETKALRQYSPTDPERAIPPKE